MKRKLLKERFRKKRTKVKMLYSCDK